MWTVYNGIEIKCAMCGAQAKYEPIGKACQLSTYILWANQHGSAIRVFCKHCDTMSDWEILYRTHVKHCRMFDMNQGFPAPC
jgi:hypothetical protein